MLEAFTIGNSLPAVVRDQPASAWIHAASVGGPFGITASVANFAEVLDWQEKRRALTQGYYRLIHPPRVQAFKARLEAAFPGQHAVLYASGPLALKEWRDFCAVNAAAALAGQARVLDFRQGRIQGGAVLLRDPALALDLHERNRRRGGALSARNVAALLAEADASAEEAGAEDACARLLCEWEAANHALFYPSGMGAVTALLDEVLTVAQPRILVVGNVYRDTHLLLEEQTWAGRPLRGEFLDTHDLDAVRRRLADPAIAGVFLETITNPLIEIPDLPAIAGLCRAAGKKLWVDSTMAAPLNACPLDLGADAVIHSTSKYISGSNTHGGGVVLTRDAALAAALRAAQDRDENRLSPLEFPALRRGLSTYPERLARFNRNGETLAAFLRSHPAVKNVWYGNQGRPAWLRGLAGVVSCELRDPRQEAVARFFDSPLPGVIKAPSLGSDQTLFCPYVLLAYYDKSEAYLRDCNLPRHLLRFAVGSEENFAPIREGLRAALDAGIR